LTHTAENAALAVCVRQLLHPSVDGVHTQTNFVMFESQVNTSYNNKLGHDMAAWLSGYDVGL